MRNRYNPWRELAAIPHLRVEWAHMTDRLGEYLHDLAVIRLDPRMPRHQARSVLCHELQHYLAGDTPTGCAVADARQELRADTNAARLLVDVHDLADAMTAHDGHLGAVADELDVALDVVETRLGHLHPSERHYLTRRLAE